VLFYFMLFAEYPSRVTPLHAGQDMEAEIQGRFTNPAFSLSATLSKKDKLKESPAKLGDIFKRMYVADSKKRMTFSNIVKHPLLAEYQGEFQENVNFSSKLEKVEEYKKDEPAADEYGFDSAT
jgi:hypothetical protein